MAIDSEFGVTAADALRLLKKAKRVLIFVAVAPGDRALFVISKRAAIAEMSRVNPGTQRPCELEGATVYFGGFSAIQYAEKSKQEAA